MLRSFKSLLTSYEVTEITSWKDIYFAGSATVEKIGGRKRRTGADLHDLFNIRGTQKSIDGTVYNHGISY
jgi:hypothetical protein